MLETPMLVSLCGGGVIVIVDSLFLLVKIFLSPSVVCIDDTDAEILWI